MTNLWYALRYASLGWKVVPCHGKIPVPGTRGKTRGTGGVHAATTDEGRILRWWGRHPNDDISLACNGQFWVLDVDEDEGRASLDALTARYGTLPKTVKQISGGGGEHYFFRHVPGLRQASGGASKAKMADGTFFWPFRKLDIKAGNCLIAVEPTFHPDTGARYEWEDGCAPWECELADAPEWLVKLATPPKVEPVDCAPILLSEGRLNGYSRAALERAIAAIESAPLGTRDCTLNREAFSIGAAVMAGLIPREVALPEIVAASQRMIFVEGDNFTKSYAMNKARNSFYAGMERGTRGQKIALRA